MAATATQYVIVEDPLGGGGGPVLRGAALALWKFKGQEVMIAGPSETGKTTAAVFKLDALLWKYPGAQAVMVRKVRDTIFPTVLQTYTKKILAPNSPVKGYGGERPAWFDYPNGSRLWLAGMDDPGKALSSERDFIYVNQCEELAEDDWQVLTTRATGRAGNAPYGQVIGDANPGPPHHWILRRSAEGQLRFLESRHEDNPTLHDGRGWTDRGRRTLAVLDGLTGVRKQRLRYGRWVAAEGQVYEGWDAAVHLIEPFKVPASWPRYWSVDFGFTVPFTIQWWARDPDGRLYLYREIYRTQRLVEDHARHALQVCGARPGDWRNASDPKPTAIVCDHDAEGRATFERHTGLPTVAANKAVKVTEGIQMVASRLRAAGDGRPRLFVMRGALIERDAALDAARKPTCLAEELPSYTWQTSGGRRKGEEPVKENDHGADACRYIVVHLDAPRPMMGNYG